MCKIFIEMLFCGQIFRYDQRMLNMLFGEFKAKADTRRLHIWKGTKKNKIHAWDNSQHVHEGKIIILCYYIYNNMLQ